MPASGGDEHSGHGGASASATGGHGASGMVMLFTTASNTPLYSAAWTPNKPGHYAGTCIFLIILAVMYRLMSAYKNVVEQKWARAEQHREIIIASKSAESRRSSDGGKEEADEETAAVEAYLGWGTRPWRWSVDLPRAAGTTLITAVSYFLMLAVMTMNVGYFLSVLAGIFIGELACGRYIRS